jgi:hypothetical protein
VKRSKSERRHSEEGSAVSQGLVTLLVGYQVNQYSRQEGTKSGLGGLGRGEATNQVSFLLLDLQSGELKVLHRAR